MFFCHDFTIFGLLTYVISHIDQPDCFRLCEAQRKQVPEIPTVSGVDIFSHNNEAPLVYQEHTTCSISRLQPCLQVYLLCIRVPFLPGCTFWIRSRLQEPLLA